MGSCKCISQSDFKCHPNGIKLTKPGKYKLKEDIKFTPTQEGRSAITICSRNVCLDLGKWQLSQGNSLEKTTGILVNRDVERITITGEKNKAKIYNFTLDGIRILGRTKYVDVRNLIIEQEEIRPLTNSDSIDQREWVIVGGIVAGEGDTRGTDMVDTDKNNHIQFITVDSVHISKHTVALTLVKCFNFSVSNSSFTENTFMGGCFGARGIIPGDDYEQYGDELDEPYCQFGKVNDCHFDKNYRPSQPESRTSQFFPVEYNRVYNIVEENNTSNDNHADIKDPETGDGYLLIATDHDAVRHCVLRKIQSNRNSSEGDQYCDGVHFSGSIGNNRPDIDVLVEDCEASDNVGGTFFGNGFQFAWVKGGTFRNCQAHRNGAPGAFFASGFVIYGSAYGDPQDVKSTDIVIDNCIASGTFGSEQNAGFFVDAGCKNVLFKNSTATNIKEAGFNSAGFLIAPTDGDNSTDFVENIVIKNCVSQNCGNINDFATGGVLLQDIFGIDLKNVVVDGITAQGNSNGIASLGDVKNMVIKNNEVDSNLGSGVIIENTCPGFVAKNLAYNNGTNYTGVPVANIVEGTDEILPVTVDSKPLHNFSITSDCNSPGELMVLKNSLSKESFTEKRKKIRTRFK